MAGFGPAEIAEAEVQLCHHSFSYHLRKQVFLLLYHDYYVLGGQGRRRVVSVGEETGTMAFLK